MYMTITDIMGEKRIDPAYPIRGREVAIVSMFSENIQYEFTKPWTVELGELWSKPMMAGTYTR